MKKITQKFTNSIWRSCFFAMTLLFSSTINSQDLSLQGIIDFTVPSGGNDGKALHVIANADIANLSLYGIGVANNGGGTDGQEYTFPAVSVSAGDNIIIARTPSAIASYLGADVATIIESNTSISQNGDDAIELYFNAEVIETFGDIDTDGTGESWEYLDSWAYKVDGAWTYGGVNCTDGSDDSASSNCPYPYTGVYTVGTEIQTETFDVTFSVNTANITVGELGMYVGGGVLGGANAYAMSDDDEDGTWTVTIALNEGTTGNYIFLNSPTADNDWGAKENLAGQSCSDPNNYDDRILDPVTADTTLLHCFGSCETDGSCPSEFFDVTFSVNTANITVGENGMYAGGGVLGDATAYAMSDDDGDGTWTVTVSLVSGTSGNYTFLNSPNDGGDWGAKENLAGQECADANNYNDRILEAVTADTTLLHCFGSCETDGTCPSTFYDVTFSVNTANIEVGPNGMYAGGGVLGDAQAYAMSDDDGDGTWTVTVSLVEGTVGNYTFLNSPNDGGDWGAKEDISGQECADGNNYNDRILAEVTGDITLLHCFGTCDTDGTCSALAVDSFPYCSSFDADLGDWTAESVSGDTNWSSAAENYNGTVVPLSGAGMAYLYDNSSVANLVSLPMDLTSLASPQVTFSYAQPVWAGDQDELRVWYKAAAGDEWSQIAEYTADTPAWETVTLDLPNASSEYYIAFNGTAGYGYGLTIDDVCVATAGVSNEELLAFLGSGSWRSEAETAGHIGVGPSGSTNAEWWNANAYDKADTGLYDDRWSFADGVLTVDTGDDGAIFGKKAEIDAAFPDNTPYDADNSDNEYLYYALEDYTDTFVADATNNTITFATNGNLGFFTSVAGQEFQILETTDNTVYLRNVGSEGNAWYNRLTTADALSTVDAMVLDMRIYPNPSNGSYVTIQTPVNGVKYVEVFDITGKRLINTSLSADTLDVSSMSSGMYLVKVTVEGQSKTSKLIIR
ncbi:T9SS type A sorting domain-containing protein [Flavobacteriaceae bacterium]|nr:T9SS type A sorting domain-containing protein [Flavobacteriaceae bacterium]MDC1180121.1 T9SS type A sorting domain-containing protein [Flavobacteriaceae bacterium]